MNFLVITHVVHKKNGDQTFAYAPYVREMNLWALHVEVMTVIAPMSAAPPGAIDAAYAKTNLQYIPAPPLGFTSPAQALRSAFAVPGILWQLFFAMRRADHIHLRCPGNMGLLGCLVQILFPEKIKTAKYAGNWDWASHQPRSYRLQQRILRNPFLTRNMTALVYGDWPDRTKNVQPFFTASYGEQEMVETPPRRLKKAETIRLIFAGTLTANKRPSLALETALLLRSRGYSVHLDFFGEGPESNVLTAMVLQNGAQNEVRLPGNVSAETLKSAYQSAHFLLFASQSEGWPKAVAEAMFWGCLPLTSAVSCVPQMLGQGSRGDLVAPNASAMAEIIEGYLEAPEKYSAKCLEAMKWSRQYTLESFEFEISRLVKHGPHPAPH